jgi:hypothetical protein
MVEELAFVYPAGMVVAASAGSVYVVWKHERGSGSAGAGQTKPEGGLELDKWGDMVIATDVASILGSSLEEGEQRDPWETGVTTEGEMVVSPAGVATVAVPRVDFQGSWKINKLKSTTPEEQMKALGISWLFRKAAAVARPSTGIVINGCRWEEHVEVGKYVPSILTQDDVLLLDGTAMHKNKHGTEVTEWTTVEEQGECVVTRILIPDKGEVEIRRYVRQDPADSRGEAQEYHVMNKLTLLDGRTILRDTYFKRSMKPITVAIKESSA